MSKALNKELKMKRITLLLLVALLSFGTYAEGSKAERRQMDPAKKAELTAKMKAFAKENQDSRKELIEKIYQIRLSNLKTTHDMQLSTLNKISDLADGIVIGEREKNKEIRQKIKQQREESKREIKAFRQESKQKVKAIREEFKQKQKARRSEMRSQRRNGKR